MGFALTEAIGLFALMVPFCYFSHNSVMFLILLIYIILYIVFILICSAMFVLLERQVMGLIQSRKGQMLLVTKVCYNLSQMV